MENVAAIVRSRISDIPDYPEPGVVFRDINPLLRDRDAFAAAIAAMAAQVKDVDLVAGIEARGFILAAPLALRIGAGFLPIRKAGKTPGATVGVDYDLEYGQARIEVAAGAICPGARVLVVDDVLATGGTALAACHLIERSGGVVSGLEFLIELVGLGGRTRLGRHDFSALLAL